MSENSRPISTPPTAEEAAAALRSIDRAEASVAEGISSPPGWDLAYGLVFGLVIGAAAVLGGAGDHLAAKIAGPLMAITAAALTGVLVSRWKKHNGVWISGYHPGPARRVTWSLVVAIGVLYAAAFFGAQAGAWWLAGLAVAVAVLTGFWATRTWTAIYLAQGSGR